MKIFIYCQCGASLDARETRVDHDGNFSITVYSCAGCEEENTQKGWDDALEAQAAAAKESTEEEK